MFQGKKIGVVVPAYNEEALIAATVNGIPRYVDRTYVINDGSKDSTRDIVSELCRQDDRLILISHTTNRGVGAAIATGYRRCLVDNLDIAVVMAGDNQMDPLELPNLLAPIVNGSAGYAKGNRMSSLDHMNGMPMWRRFGNWLLKWLTRVSSGNYKITDPQNGYSAASIDALQKIDLESLYPYYGYCNHLLAKCSVAGVKVVEVSMPARYQGEKSKIRYSRYIPRVSWLLVRVLSWRMKERLASFAAQSAASSAWGGRGFPRKEASMRADLILSVQESREEPRQEDWA